LNTFQERNSLSLFVRVAYLLQHLRRYGRIDFAARGEYHLAADGENCGKDSYFHFIGIILPQRYEKSS